MNTAITIKQLLTKSGPLTIKELSRSLDLTKADVHYQVRQLLKNNEIYVISQKYQSGPGRPARRFQVVEDVPLLLTRLVITVLRREIRVGINSPQYSVDVATEIAKTLISSCPSAHKWLNSPGVKLNHIISELKPIGVDLRWEATSKGPNIHVLHESLSTLFQDKTLVESILNSLIKQIKEEVA